MLTAPMRAVNHYFDKHFVKAGTEVRWKRGQAARFRYSTSQFVARETANTFSSPNSKTGSPWASFLLGAMDAANSFVQYTPMQKANTEMYAFYVQDDWKISNKLTVNLGLRYEYEGGYWDPLNRIQQNLDLTDPIPGMQAAIDPKMPADVKAKMAESTGQKSYHLQWRILFHRRTATTGPRAPTRWVSCPASGLAWRLTGNTAIRVGYGRFYRAQLAHHAGPGCQRRTAARRLLAYHQCAPDAVGHSAGVLCQSLPTGPDSGLRQSPMAATRSLATPSPSTRISRGRRSAIASTYRFRGSCRAISSSTSPGS